MKIKPLILSKFTQGEVSDASIKKITKKELKDLAQVLGLDYDDTHIVFAKKILNAYLIGNK